MITDREIDQAYTDHRSDCGGLREDYFGLIYLEREHAIPRQQSVNYVAFGGNDYGVDGFYFDAQKRNLYIYQFKNSTSHNQFKSSFVRLIESGLERIFVSPNRDPEKNQILIQLRSCLLDNRQIIEQVSFRFVFRGNPEEADSSKVLERLREDLENKKYLVDQFFKDRSVGFVVEYRSTTGRVGGLREPNSPTEFSLRVQDYLEVGGPDSEKMYVGFARLSDLNAIYSEMNARFFDSNIRYGLGDGEAVNRAIAASLKSIVIDGDESPKAFVFNHNGITLAAESVSFSDGHCKLRAPRLLNGAQTVTTFNQFLKKSAEDPRFARGSRTLDDVQVMFRIVTASDPRFVTKVTINNNRQNPVEPWNLRANDLIQLELQDKFRLELNIYYERQENAFDQLGPEALEEYGITEDSRAIQMLKLTQTFLLSDGQISRLSDMRRIFEEDKIYEKVFRESRTKANARHVLLCYKIQFNLRKYSRDIEQKAEKYWFISRARNLLWALLCQGVLNHPKINDLAERHGSDMTIPVDFKEVLSGLAINRVKPMLLELINDPDYVQKVRDQEFGFLRTDRAFEKCMGIAHNKWKWTHRKLG